MVHGKGDQGRRESGEGMKDDERWQKEKREQKRIEKIEKVEEVAGEGSTAE